MMGRDPADEHVILERTSQSARSKKRGRWLAKRLALAGFSIVIALSIAEIGLRLFVEQELRRSAIYDRDLGWRGRPYANGLYVRRQDDIRTSFRYNNLGYRDEDVVARREGEAEIRVMLLGDSFLENLEVDYEHVFHKRLEEQLNANAPPKFSAVAIGSQGYSTAQELLAFRRFKDDVEPNIVVTVFYTGNDFEDNARPRFAYLNEQDKVVLPPNKESPLQFQTKSMTRWIYESSHLVYLIKNQVQRLANVNLQDASKETGSVDDETLRKLTLGLLSQTRQEVEAAGAVHGIIIIPSRDELLAKDLTRVNLIASYCDERDVPHLNLANCLTPEDYFEVDVHFTVDGHERVSHEIATFLKSEFAEIVAPCFATDSVANNEEPHYSH